jgi:hypothetical protein
MIREFLADIIELAAIAFAVAALTLLYIGIGGPA